MRKKIVGMLGATAYVCVGCSLSDGIEPNTKGREATAEVTEEYSSVGVERIIPVTFMQVSNANPPVLGASTDDIKLSLEITNRVFRPTGIQFDMKYNNSYYTPNLYHAYADCIENISTECANYGSTPATYLWTDQPDSSSKTIGNDINQMYPSAQNPGITVQKN